MVTVIVLLSGVIGAIILCFIWDRYNEWRHNLKRQRFFKEYKMKLRSIIDELDTEILPEMERLGIVPVTKKFKDLYPDLAKEEE